MEQILILGTGGTSLEIAEAIEAVNAVWPAWRIVGFLDDNPDMQGHKVGKWAVVGRLVDAARFREALFINGIGSPKSHLLKREIIERTGVPLSGFATIVHPTASVSPSATLEPGVAVLSHAVVGACARVEAHVVILPHTYVGHHSRIGAFGCLAAGVAIGGGCDIGPNCYLGSGCKIRESLVIGEGSLIGMGAVVVKPVAAGSVVVGNPARPLTRDTRLKPGIGPGEE